MPTLRIAPGGRPVASMLSAQKFTAELPTDNTDHSILVVPMVEYLLGTALLIIKDDPGGVGKMRAALAGLLLGVCSAVSGRALAGDCPVAPIVQSVVKMLDGGEICFPKGEIYVVPDKDPRRDGFHWMELHQVDVNRALSRAAQSFEVRDLPLGDLVRAGPAIGKIQFIFTSMVNEPSYRELNDRHCIALGTFAVDDVVSTRALRGGADIFCLVHLTFHAKSETTVGRALINLFFQSWGQGEARPERKARVLMKADPIDGSWALHGIDQANRDASDFATDSVGQLVRDQGLR